MSGELDRVEMPMFPLGSVLVPGMLLPLHVFEDRYRTMMDHVLAGDETFGVTMIERGSEVGGGDARAPIGCRARVLDARQHADGRWSAVAVGVDRLRVDRWLDDDPYPRALVSSFPDTASMSVMSPDAWRGTVDAFDTLIALVERVAGSEVGPAPVLADDPAMATFQMAAIAPIGVLDRYLVLCGEDAGVRAALLNDAFEHATVLVNDSASN